MASKVSTSCGQQELNVFDLHMCLGFKQKKVSDGPQGMTPI